MRDDKKQAIDAARVLARYSSLSLQERFHIAGRLKACPWDRIIGHLPPGRRLMDIGCGHGLFLNLLQLSGNSYDKLTGFDPDGRKIAVAARSADDRVEFISASEELVPGGADIYTLVDVLYLVPFEMQEKIIAGIHAKLPPGGHLVIKELDTKPFPKFAFAYLEELVMVRLLKATLGSRFYFRSAEAFKELTEQCGFETEIIELQKGYLHPHVMLVGRKQPKAAD